MVKKGRKPKEFCVNGHDLSITREHDGINYHCSECKKLRNKKYNKLRVYDKDKAKKASIKRLYNLEWREYQNLLDQYEKCPVCEASFYEKYPCVDHDKETGKIRGILCSNCNTGIGLLKHSKEYLKRALIYLERSELK